MPLLVLFTAIYTPNSQYVHSHCQSVRLLSHLCSSIHPAPGGSYCFDINSGTHHFTLSDTERCIIKTEIHRNYYFSIHFFPHIPIHFSLLILSSAIHLKSWIFNLEALSSIHFQVSTEGKMNGVLFIEGFNEQCQELAFLISANIYLGHYTCDHA